MSTTKRLHGTLYKNLRGLRPQPATAAKAEVTSSLHRMSCRSRSLVNSLCRRGSTAHAIQTDHPQVTKNNHLLLTYLINNNNNNDNNNNNITNILL